MGILKKKSGFEDAFFAIAVILTLAIFILVISKAWSEIKTPLDTSITNSLPANSSINVTKTFDVVSDTTILFNKLLPFVIIGLFAFIFIGMAIYFNHPMMIVVGLIVLAVAVLLGSIYSNIYQEISSSDSFSTQKEELGVQDKYMQYLPYIIIGIFIACTIGVLYLRKGGGSGQL